MALLVWHGRFQNLHNKIITTHDAVTSLYYFSYIDTM